jgi:hypothetical protein
MGVFSMRAVAIDAADYFFTLPVKTDGSVTLPILILA